MKKMYFVLTAILIALTISACKTTTTTTATTVAPAGHFNYPNGQYFAIDSSASNGFKYWVVVTIDNKTITNVVWDGYNVDGGASKCVGQDKLTCAAEGLYGLNNPVNGAVSGKGTWDMQAKAAVKWIVDNQSITAPTSSSTDAMTSVSVDTSDLFTLIGQAFANGAVAHGNYAHDGYYYIQTTPTSKSYAYRLGTPDGTAITGTFASYTMGTFIIVNGKLVYADFNATQTCYQYVLTSASADATNSANWETGNAIGSTAAPYVIAVKSDGSTPVAAFVTKNVAGAWYGMDWSTQAAAAAQKLVQDQTLNITVTAGTNGAASTGSIDGLASVSTEHTVVDFANILAQLDAEAGYSVN